MDVLLVLGPHRGGTSSVAGVLYLLGAALPKTLMPADDLNERGYFESQVIYRFDDELLNCAGSSWDDWRAFRPAWSNASGYAAFKRQAGALFTAEFRDCALAVLKDPRICRLIPFWLDILGETKAEPHAVIPVRSPLEVAQSLKGRDGFPLTKGLLIWLRHMLDAEAATRALPRAIFSWNAFLTDWRGMADRISAGTEIAWPNLTDCTARRVDQFLSHELKHQSVKDTELVTHPDVHAWTRLAYEALLVLAEDPGSNGARAQLDEVGHAFERASSFFDRVVLDYEIAQKTAHEERMGLARTRDEITVLLDASRAEKDRIAAERDATRAHRDEIAAKLAERTGEVREQERIATALRTRTIDAEAALAYRQVNSTLRSFLRLGRESRRTAQQLMKSGLFDAQWYVSRYGDVAESGTDPAEHYVRIGFSRGYFPHPLFDTRHYLEQNDDVRLSGINPLLHYVASGCREGRGPNAYFNGPWYIETYPDVAALGAKPLQHYATIGFREGRNPGPLFDGSFYLQANPDVRAAGFDPLFHYIHYGRQEGRLPASPKG